MQTRTGSLRRNCARVLGGALLAACGADYEHRGLGTPTPAVDPQVPETDSEDPDEPARGESDDGDAVDTGADEEPDASESESSGGVDDQDDQDDEGPPPEIIQPTGRSALGSAGYYVQLIAGPTAPINGRYGVHGWHYINATQAPAGIATDQSGWMGFDANGAAAFRIHMGHGRQASNMQDLFVEVHSSPVGTVLECENPEGGGSTSTGSGIMSCFSDAYAAYGVPSEGWYGVAAGDVWEDDRWKIQIRVNDLPFATIDFDNAGGFSGLHQVAEMSTGSTYDLGELYDFGFRWGASFAGFEVATETNGVVGPFEYLGGDVTTSSVIFGEGVPTQFGNVGCDAGSPGGNGRVVQAKGWYVGFPTSSAGGTSPPIAGACS